MKNIETPYYLIDESKLLKNLKKIKYLKDNYGVKSVLALKCFSSWCVFDLMRRYMDGTTSSSLYEARLGYEKFKKEVHAYSAAFSKSDIDELKKFSNKVIFNSISQLKMFYTKVRNLKIGLRINPQISYSDFDLADPARKYSRLGVKNYKSVLDISHLLSGVMFHCNCENENFNKFSSYLDHISKTYAELLNKLEWVSLGGGIYFTKDTYPLEKFGKKLKNFGDKFGVQVYLEPGETAVTQSAYLVTKVLDIVHNEIDIAIVDSSIEAHMLDLLVYRTQAKIENNKNGKYKYMIAGKSCLAGDIFGMYNFKSKLKAGSTINISDAAGYTMVKKNWFNGLAMPSIVVKRLNGSYDIAKKFSYKDYIQSLS
ncbi:MAG: carboxynorspermidine decarboxylase [Elusimicrobia bacterium]|nr:carboxynorspermidine decarboxylase [Elusimicrobiota bacterium]